MNEDFDMVAMEVVTNQYLGGDTSLACSPATQQEIDQKVVALVKKQHEKAKKILRENIDALNRLADYLYEKETITGDEFMKILDNIDEPENDEPLGLASDDKKKLDSVDEEPGKGGVEPLAEALDTDTDDNVNSVGTDSKPESVPKEKGLEQKKQHKFNVE